MTGVQTCALPILPNLTERYFKRRQRPERKNTLKNRPEPNPTVLELAGLTGRELTLYSLRHTMATLLLLSNVNPKIVSERLGHASVKLTLDTYSHVLPHIQADATDTMDRVLRGSR